MRSIESISHKLDSYAAALRPEREAQQIHAFAQTITPDGKVRADRVSGFLPPHVLPLDAIERGVMVTLDFPSIAAGAVGTLTAAVTGAQVTDAVMLGAPSTLTAGLVAFGFVSAKDTVTVRLFNGTAGAINPPAEEWRVVVMR